MNNATYGTAAIVIPDLKLIEIVDQSLSNMCMMSDNNSAVIVILNPSRFFWGEKKRVTFTSLYRRGEGKGTYKRRQTCSWCQWWQTVNCPQIHIDWVKAKYEQAVVLLQCHLLQSHCNKKELWWLNGMSQQAMLKVIMKHCDKVKYICASLKCKSQGSLRHEKV